VLAAWRAITGQHPAAEVVAVSHGAAIGTGLAVLLHADPRAWMRFMLRNTSVTEVELEPVARLLALDVVDHLGGA
jgi:broad specificity phosphatase PhoE